MNINSCDDLIKYLDSVKDEAYRLFTFKLLKNDDINLIGVRTPILRKIAKYLSKRDYEEYFSHNSYEETMIYGFILGYLNVSFDVLLNYLNDFIPYIDNWSVCDLTVSNLKAFKNNQDAGFKFILNCINSDNIWEKRFGVVLINSYFVNDNYINDVINVLSNIHTDEYYLQMAIAWCLSTCYIKYPNLVLDLLIGNKLDLFIHNKTIQKIIESYRVDDETKFFLRNLRRKA